MELEAHAPLVGVEGPHPVHVVPDLFCPAARRHHHEGGRELLLPVQLLRQGHMVVVVIDLPAGLVPVDGLEAVYRQGGQFLAGEQPVAAASPIPVGIQLPPGPGVLLLALLHRDVGIGFGPVGGQLAEEEEVFGAAHPHLGTVLALLTPAQTIGLVVLPHHIGDDGHHAEVLEPVGHVVLDAEGVKGLDGGHPGAGGASKQDPVFHMDRQHPPRPQDPQQLRGEKIHLVKKTGGVLVVAEIVVAGGVFVVVGEGDGGVDQVHRVVRHPAGFGDTIVVDGGEVVPPDLLPRHPDAPLHPGQNPLGGDAVLPQQAAHLGRLGLVPLPLGQQLLQDGRLVLGVDHVDDHPLPLEKPVDPVDGLEEVVKLVVDPHKDGPVAMALEIAAAAGDLLLGSQQAGSPLGEIHHPDLPLLQGKRPVHLHRLRQGFLDGPPLLLQVVPEEEMGLWVAVHNLLHLGHPGGQALPLLPGCLHQPLGRVPGQLHLAVRVLDPGVPRRQLVVP